MRILVISEVPTHPSTAGNRSYLRSICDTLKRQGHEVEFLHVATYSRRRKHRWLLRRPGSEPEMAAAWGSGLHTYKTTIRDIGQHWAQTRHTPQRWSKWAPAGLAAAIESLVRTGGFNAVVVNYWNLMSSVEHLRGIPRVLVANDSFANGTRTESDWKVTDPISEAKAFDTADAVLAIQDHDAMDFRTRTGTPVVVTYHSAQVNPLPLGDTANLLFLSSQNPQNAEGLQHFLDQTFPILRSAFPNVRLLIAGPICDSLSGAGVPDGVILQGVVDRLSDFYAQGNICISPNFRGGGLKTKVLEALAHGRTVLASPYSLHGFPPADPAPLIACASPGQYVDAIHTRLTYPELLDGENIRAVSYARTMNARFQRAIESALLAADSADSSKA